MKTADIRVEGVTTLKQTAVALPTCYDICIQIKVKHILRCFVSDMVWKSGCLINTLKCH